MNAMRMLRELPRKRSLPHGIAVLRVLRRQAHPADPASSPSEDGDGGAVQGGAQGLDGIWTRRSADTDIGQGTEVGCGSDGVTK